MDKVATQPARTPLDWAKAAVPVMIVVGAVAALEVFGHRPPPPTVPPETSAAQVVKVEPARPFTGTFDISVEGVARPFRQISLAAEVAGKIRFKSPKCQEATYVEQGELLLEIDPTDYELAVQRATNELAQTQNSLKEWSVERDNTLAQITLAERDLELATTDVERTRQLATRGGASAAEIEAAQRTELAARNALLTANNALRLLNARYDRAVSARDFQTAQLKKAQLDLARTKITAPCAGTIVTESVEQDAYVQIGNPVVVLNDTSAGEVVCQIEMDDMVWLWAQRTLTSSEQATPTSSSAETPANIAALPVSAADAYYLPRIPVTIEFPVGDLVCRWQGALARFGGAGIDLQTRTVPCLVEVAEPRSGKLQRGDGQPEKLLAPPPLTPGMFVKVHIRIEPHLPLVALPASGLRPGGMVWLARNGQLHEAPLQVARRLPGQVLGYVKPDGPQPGESVIVTPLAFPREGMPVQGVAP